MLKDFTPWQKLQFYLVSGVVLLFMLCFALTLFGFETPPAIQPYILVFWSVILVFIDPRTLISIVNNSNIKEKKDEE